MSRFLQILAVGVLLAGSARSVEAAFTYTSNGSNVELVSGSTAGGFSVGGQQSFFPAPTPTTLTLLSFGYNSPVSAPASENFSYSLTDTVTITNVPPPGVSDTQSLNLAIVLSFNNINSTRTGTTYGITINGVANGAGVTATVLVGAYYYTLSNFVYTPPTSNTLVNGSLTASLTAVPEPGSMALLCVAGTLGLAGLGRRRLQAAH